MEKKNYNYINPKHYTVFEDITALDIIKKTLNEQEFIGFLKGNILKYKLRVGDKPGEPPERDLAKALYYKKLLYSLNSQLKIQLNESS